jgi:hypothetical protein
MGPDGSESLLDTRMMFGCRAAASWGQRCSGFLAWSVQQVMDSVRPKSAKVQRAYEILRMSDAVPEADKRYRCAYISSFLDDLPMVCVASVAEEFQMIQSAMWSELGFIPQGKKCWWEGGFASK